MRFINNRKVIVVLMIDNTRKGDFQILFFKFQMIREFIRFHYWWNSDLSGSNQEPLRSITILIKFVLYHF